MPSAEVPVLIVGGGLAGLTAAVMLACYGFHPLLVERRTTTSLQPRARGVNLRSMEVFRPAGLEDELCSASPLRLEQSSIVVAESVTGRVFKTLLEPGSWDSSGLSPSRASGAAQERIEPVLRRRAQALGADIRFCTEAISLEQDADAVVVKLKDRDTEQYVRARYVIAADGASSRIRTALGIGTSGHGTLANYVSILFATDPAKLTSQAGFTLYYLQNPAFTGVFINTDYPDRGLVAFESDPSSPPPLDAHHCISIVRAALGLPDLDLRLLEVAPWEMTSRLADCFTSGRVFLAGDAAHTMPPTGGLGGQTAIQDAADLAWKLALVLRGDAAPGLLDTYNAERRPVAELTVATQTANYVRRLRPDREELATAGAGESDYLGVMLGYRYRSDSILTDAPDDGAAIENPLHPTARPGTRCPHFVLADANGTLSTLDLPTRGRRRPGFALLAGPEAAAWADAARHLASSHSWPLSPYTIGSELRDLEDQWHTGTGLPPSGALLLRPDGFIAWRSAPHRHACESRHRDDSGTDPALILEQVMHRVLCLNPLGSTP